MATASSQIELILALLWMSLDWNKRGTSAYESNPLHMPKESMSSFSLPPRGCCCKGALSQQQPRCARYAPYSLDFLWLPSRCRQSIHEELHSRSLPGGGISPCRRHHVRSDGILNGRWNDSRSLTNGFPRKTRWDSPVRAVSVQTSLQLHSLPMRGPEAIVSSWATCTS